MASSSNAPPVGSVQPMNQDALRALIMEHDKAFERNSSSMAQQDEVQEEYKALGTVLKTLPDKISHEALVPIGPLVMAPGKLIHTNEIMCHMGQNYFVECSAKTALKLVEHRMQKSKEAKTALEKEKELIVSWRKEAMRELIDSVDEGTVEIREECDDEQHERWKKEHREKVKKHHQELAKKKLEQKQNGTEAVTGLLEDTELWEKLDQLELEEDLARYEKSKRKAKKANANASSSKSTLAKSGESKKIESSKNANPQQLTSSSVAAPTNKSMAGKPILKSAETLAAVREKLSESMSNTGSLKRRVSFDQSKDSTHVFERDNQSPPPEHDFTPPPAPPPSPATSVLASDFIKSVVVERNPGLDKKKENTEEISGSTSTSAKSERISLFKQKGLAAAAAAAEQSTNCTGSGDGPPVDEKPAERISLFKQRRLEMEAQNPDN